MRSLFLAIFCLIFLACKDKYTRLVERELATGQRHDTLFLGLKLAMPQKEFIDTCWQLNRRGLIKHGTEALTVCHEMGSEFSHPATMNLYPDFTKKGLIRQVPVIFKYNDWQPWRKELAIDSLQNDVIRYFERTYGGNRFERFEVKKLDGEVWIKIDGNREILLAKHRDMEKMKAIICDLSVPKSEFAEQ